MVAAKEEGVWDVVYPPLVEKIAEAVIQEVDTYAGRHQKTVAK